MNWQLTVGYDGERILIGAQDQGLLTNGLKKIAKILDNEKYRLVPYKN